MRLAWKHKVIKKRCILSVFILKCWLLSQGASQSQVIVYNQQKPPKELIPVSTPLSTCTHKIPTFASKSTQHSKFQHSPQCVIQTVTVQRNCGNIARVSVSTSLWVNLSVQVLLSRARLHQFSAEWVKPVLITVVPLVSVTYSCVRLPRKLRRYLLYPGPDRDTRQQAPGTYGQDRWFVDNYRDGRRHDGSGL